VGRNRGADPVEPGLGHLAAFVFSVRCTYASTG
jgi:hypothetical protein